MYGGEIESNFAKTQTNTIDRTISQFKGKINYDFNSDILMLNGLYENESGDRTSTLYNVGVLDEHYFDSKFGVYGKLTTFKDTNKLINQSQKYNVGILYRHNKFVKSRIGYEVQDKDYTYMDTKEYYTKIGFIMSYNSLEAILDRNIRVGKAGTDSTELEASMKLYEDKGFYVKFGYKYYKEDKPILLNQTQNKTELKTLIGVGYEF